ncbi:DNA phosphorothioation-dependent restriction protein DptG [Pontibacter sp. G13]|uniref:DNA phosphorothioation-dependent restriction protein DptG n=1 Tax=Pontibacter sp. G13 TaxID=3074898 RepID=UPI00288B317E|nr:DNA phosphorothioation-dependent restriction protein DptG [Pontibacter sp. G13]WNJ17163.1 DNA phosphorothioation-dependent restriction protein DptG [Pontibacter sp. G13]
MVVDIDPQRYLKSYLTKSGDIKHKLGGKFAILPYSTKFEKKQRIDLRSDFKSFHGLVGESFRIALDKDIPRQLRTAEEGYKERLMTEILERATEKTNFDNDIELKEKLRSVLKGLFFEGDNLVKFSHKSLNYMGFSYDHKGLNNIATFLESIFFDKEVVESLKREDNRYEHVLYQLVNDSLPELEHKEHKKVNYQNLFPYISDQFREDFLFLRKDHSAYLDSVPKLIQLYYFIYVAKSALKLNSFFEHESFPLYFTLEGESFTESRKAFNRGWSILEPKVNNLFSHAICLDILNHIDLSEDPKSVFDYQSLVDSYYKQSADNQEAIKEKLDQVIACYQENIPSGQNDVAWKEVNGYNEFDSFLERQMLFINHRDGGIRERILRLWYSIDFQFNHSVRNKPYKQYANWFKEFSALNFLKNRGRNGRSLNLTNDMLLFLTKICVKDEEKIRLKDFWKELEKRGIYLDNGSQEYVTNLFEKFNLLEKKSDSGDAQYVRSI